MTLAEYARLEEAAGARLVERGGVFWRRVRPFFYRPLLLSEPVDERTLLAPCRWPGGFQHVVCDPAHANSTMNFLVYHQTGDYDLQNISHEHRRVIKKAARRFQVRLVESLPELVEQGHRAYLSFYQRTGYGYLADRKNKASFAAWAERLMRSKAIVLGAYGDEGLTAVSVSYWIADTLEYASLFADTASLKQGVCEVLLHELRRAVGQQPMICHIVARNYQGGIGLDQYYLLRGAQIVRKPARFVVNAAARVTLRTFFPRAYAGLSGTP
jgi:hypothetical protein